MRSLLLVLLLAATAVSQEAAVFPVQFADGRDARVSVVALDGDEVKLKQHVLGGVMTITESLDAFSPTSRMRIVEAANAGGTFDSELAMAKQAADWRLLGPAGRHAQLAIEAAKGTPEAAAREAEVRSWAADALEAAVRRAVGEDDLEHARHCMKLLATRLADQRTEEQLDALSAEVDGLYTKRRDARDAERQARRDAAVVKTIERRMEPVRAQVARGDARLRESIRKSGKTVESSRLAEAAIADYRAAWKSATTLGEKYADDTGVAEEVREIGLHVRDQAIRAALHAANVLTVQSDYKNAMSWTDKVLAFDPDNAEAKEMRRTIQIAAAAASSQWGWGWRTVGGAPDPRQRRQR